MQTVPLLWFVWCFSTCRRQFWFGEGIPEVKYHSCHMIAKVHAMVMTLLAVENFSNFGILLAVDVDLDHLREGLPLRCLHYKVIHFYKVILEKNLVDIYTELKNLWLGFSILILGSLKDYWQMIWIQWTGKSNGRIKLKQCYLEYLLNGGESKFFLELPVQLSSSSTYFGY